MTELGDCPRMPSSSPPCHERRHVIPYEGAALLHLDLHPENVLLSPSVVTEHERDAVRRLLR